MLEYLRDNLQQNVARNFLVLGVTSLTNVPQPAGIQLE